MKTVVSGPFEIELHPAKTKTCKCCGRKHHSLLRFVSYNGSPHAIYYAMVQAHQGEPVSVLVTFGDFGEEEHDVRFSIAFDLRSDEENIITTVVGEEKSHWSAPEGSRFITQSEALEFMQGSSFLLSELVAWYDPVVSKYLRDEPDEGTGPLNRIMKFLRLR
jgi:hypothetical protein